METSKCPKCVKCKSNDHDSASCPRTVIIKALGELVRTGPSPNENEIGNVRRDVVCREVIKIRDANDAIGAELARLQAALEEAERKRDESIEFGRQKWSESMKVKDAIKSPDKLFASQLEYHGSEKIREQKDEIAALHAQRHDLQSQLTAAAERAERAEKESNAMKELLVAARALPYMVREREYAEPGGPEWTRWDNNIDSVFDALSAAIGDVDPALLHQTQEPSDGK